MRYSLCRIVVAAMMCYMSSALSAQPSLFDSSYVLPYSKNNVVELYSGVYNTEFHFTNMSGVFSRHHSNFRLAANSSAYIGGYFNYKWLSLNYSTAMPGTQLDKNIKLQLTSIRLHFGSNKMRFHPFYDNYNGLLIVRGHREGYDAFKRIRFIDAGLDYYYFTNTKRFSYRAANYFSEQQLKSIGSLFFCATPMWQKIAWKNPSTGIIKDSATYKLLASNPQWITCTISAGYSYNFSFDDGKWVIAPAVMAGAGLLKEMNNHSSSFEPNTVLQAWVNAGYNGTKYYIYINARWADLKTNLEIKNMHQVNTGISVTAGFRFGNATERILKIL